jgi:FkbM family methyltransferase
MTARNPFQSVWRYYFKRGGYPYTIGLRTPIGAIQLELYSRQDLITVHEVFFREDYRVPSNVRLAVDFGSNIGITSAYFLTRNAILKVYAYEPVPTNMIRAKRNLAPFADRVEFVESAVGTDNGRVSFGVESSGRYGGITRPYKDRIEVPCRRANNELQRILRRHQQIDVLKIDVEGMEEPILRSFGHPELAAISQILAECDGRNITLPKFDFSQYLSIARFTARV